MAATILLSGCGDADDEPEAQPAPDVTRFTEDGVFDAIPEHPRATPVGPRQEVGGAMTRSWEVRNATPEAVVRYYAETLPAQGWDPVEAPHQVNQSWRGSWRGDDGVLEVSAGMAPTLEPAEAPSEAPVVQYSVTLRPA